MESEAHKKTDPLRGSRDSFGLTDGEALVAQGKRRRSTEGAQGTNTGHENGEAMACRGVRVERTVRLGSEGTEVDHLWPGVQRVAIGHFSKRLIDDLGTCIKALI